MTDLCVDLANADLIQRQSQLGCALLLILFAKLFFLPFKFT